MMMCLGLLGSKGRRRGKGRTFLNSSYEKRNSVRETIIPPPNRWQDYIKWQILMIPK